VLVAGLALAGCGQPQRPTIQESGTTTPQEPTAQALHAILSRRAQALTAGDEKAFLADLDQSNRKLIEQQQLIFANLRQFKLKAFKYLSPEIVATNQDGDVYRFEPIHEVVQLTADDGPGGVSPASSFRYSVTRRDGKLLIVEILPYTRANAKQFDLDGLAADAPWYLTRLTVRHAGTVCLAADHGVTDLDHYAAVAQAELRYVKGLWGDRLQFPGQILPRNPGPVDVQDRVDDLPQVVLYLRDPHSRALRSPCRQHRLNQRPAGVGKGQCGRAFEK